MNTLRTLSVALGICMVLLIAPASLFAQPSAPPQNCNQPLPDAITDVKIAGKPWHAVSSKDGCYVFLAVGGGSGDILGIDGVAVLKRTASGMSQIGFVNLPGKMSLMALTHDEKILVAGVLQAVALLDVERLMSGSGDPLLGYIDDHFTGIDDVALTQDDKYLFVSDHNTSRIGVIDFDKIRKIGFAPRSSLFSPSASATLGSIPTGPNPQSMAISPDQRFLFVTSTESPDPTKSTRMCNRTAVVNPNYREGVVLVIDVDKAISAPKSAVISEVWAGCLPARLALSPDGNKMYVTAREDNELLVFDTRPVQTGGSPKLVGKMPTGNAPVGVVAANGGKRIIVSNSNQFSNDAKRSDNLSVFDVQEGNDTYAKSGMIPAGGDPRNLFLGADGRTLLVPNRESGSLQIIDLPRATAALARPQAAQLAKPENCNQPLAYPVTNVRIGDNPWQIAATRDGCWIFISVGGGAGAVGRKGVAVLHRIENKVDMVHFEPIAAGSIGQAKLTHDEKILILGAGSQAVFLDVDKLKSGQQNALLGSIRDQRFEGTANLAVTSDDQYVFVTQRDTAWVSVINLKKARETGYSSAAITGGIPAGPTPVLLLSPDERYLYVFTTETVSDFNKPPACKASASLLKNREGAILVVDVEREKSNPAEAVIAAVEGSCRPGGVAISPDGNTLYETSLEDNALLAFDTRAIRTGSSSILIGKVPVAPVVGSVTLIDGGKRILVSSGNPFGGGTPPSKNQIITVIDAATVSSGASAVIGRLDSGVAVTTFAVTADGRSLITTERASGTVQVIDLDRVQLQH